MDAQKMMAAKRCLHAAHDGSLSFPEIVGTLIDAGFEGYAVDYRAGSQQYHLPDGETLALEMPGTGGTIAARFDAETMARLVRWAQANGPDYSYESFSEKAKAAGCAGYLVSFLGKRVVYFGRTAETHVELFPQ